MGLWPVAGGTAVSHDARHVPESHAPSRFHRLLTVLWAWIPVVGWAGFIFWGSTDVLSANHTSRFLTPFFHWLIPSLSDPQIDVIRTIIRKGGHVTEYLVLAVLIWRALYRPGAKPREWSVRIAAWAWFAATGYAASDEFHQSFYASRQASVGDVLIDASGAVLGLVLLWGFGCWRRWWISGGP